MLALWLYDLRELWMPLGAFGNASLRSALAALTAFAVALTVGAMLIRVFRSRRVIEDTSQPDHAELDAIQKQKKDVPTMGGLMILSAVIVALALWADFRGAYVQIGIFCLASLGLLGLVDDRIKLASWQRRRRQVGTAIRDHTANCTTGAPMQPAKGAPGRPVGAPDERSRGLKKRTKLLFQFALGAVVGVLILVHTRGHDCGTRFYVPFAGGLSLDLGLWYVVWASFVIAASSNGVNLADGLDGLAGGCAAMVAAALLGFGWFVSQPDIGEYLALPHVPGGAELCVLSAAVVGAMLGFLWYNCHPAQIFMGDTGSLALGGLLGFIALALKLDLLLFLVGLVFFVDMLTVAMQIVSFKLTRRRIFPITPIHHYFQTTLRWPEQKITVRLWIIAALAAVASLVVLRFG